MSAQTPKPAAGEPSAAGGEPTPVVREVAIDRFRGGLVVLMVAGNFGAGVAAVPAALKHAEDIGLTVADLVAPAFVFAIALTYGPSLDRRLRSGAASAYAHAVLRYLALIGIGAILTAGGAAVAGVPGDWGVLQALGVAGLLCLPVLRLPVMVRVAIGLAVLVAYQLALDAWFLETVRGSVHGGFLGAIAWGALLILATAVADLRRAGTGRFAIACGVLAVLAIVSAILVPVSKNRVSPSYLLIALGVSAVAFLLVDLASRVLPRHAGPVAWWGENPLVLYLAHLLLLGILLIPGIPAGWYAEAPLGLAVGEVVLLLAILTVLARAMHRGSIRLRL